MTPTLLAIDPGFAALGWCVLALGSDAELLAAGGTTTSPPGKRKRHAFVADVDALRMGELRAELAAAIERWRPAVVAMESPLAGRSFRAAKAMGMGYAVAVCAALEAGRTPIVVTPQDAKDAAEALLSPRERGGRRRAEKAEVAEAVIGRFGLDAWRRALEAEPDLAAHEHAFDAAAIALAVLSHPTVQLAASLAA